MISNPSIGAEQLNSHFQALNSFISAFSSITKQLLRSFLSSRNSTPKVFKMSARLILPTRTNSQNEQVEDTRIAVVMVGLPARGKSLIAQKGERLPRSSSLTDIFSSVVRYLAWLSVRAKVFNVGSYRRNDTPQPTADFFDTSNADGERLRHAAAEAAVKDMLSWFESGQGVVAILDATNSIRSRRRWVHEYCEKAGIATLFVESICDDEALIMSNIREVKTTSPDYMGQDPELAAVDFRNRIRNYEKVYEPVGGAEEKDLSYVKLIDVGRHVIINGIKDYLQSRVIYYLMNLHIKPRSIWLSRVSPLTQAPSF